MQERHSVRSYTGKPIEGEKRAALQSYIKQCNQESGLHFQLVLDESNAFDSFLAHYGKFSGVRTYIALVGKKGREAGGSVWLLRREGCPVRADSGAKYLLGGSDLQQRESQGAD